MLERLEHWLEKVPNARDGCLNVIEAAMMHGHEIGERCDNDNDIMTMTTTT